jgi:MerR family transcriptional regulator/heat shock protein HspR
MTENTGDTGAPAPDRGVYGISVAAELSGVAVQSLRLYERYGLLTPTRSDGGTRRYSADDLARLQRISALVDAGVNLAGIARILSLEDDNAALSEANTDLQSTNRTLRDASKGARSHRAKKPEGVDSG